MLRGSLHHHPMLRDVHALALLDLGRDADARTALGALAGPGPRVVGLHVAGPDRAARAPLEPARRPAGDRRPPGALEPYRDRLAVAQFMLGSVRHAQAELALAAGDLAEASHHGEAALATHERLGWTPWVERTRDLLGRVGGAAPDHR